jgi:hypothetical protein
MTLRSPLCTYSTLFITAVATTSIAANADLVGSYSLGSGNQEASIQFDFDNGNSHLYTIRWDNQLTGRGVFDLIAAEQSNLFGYDYIAYSFGDFITEVTIGDDQNIGDGSEAPDYVNYWHYWTAEIGQNFESSMIGAGDRNLINGSADAWVFGSNDGPATIPAPATILAVSLTLFTSRRRRSTI